MSGHHDPCLTLPYWEIENFRTGKFRTGENNSLVLASWREYHPQENFSNVRASKTAQSPAPFLVNASIETTSA